MSLDLAFFERLTNISAKVICDSIVRELSKHDKTIILAYDLGFRFDFDSFEMIRPSGHRRKVDKVYGKQRYPFDGFSHNGSNLSFKVHRFCAYLKYGNQLFNSGLLVRHLDDNPLNLSWDNIVLGTQKENAEDQPKDSRIARAKYARSFQVRPPTCRTDDHIVEEILRLYFSQTKGLGRSPWGLNKKLAEQFKKPRTTIDSIVCGKSFKDIYSRIYNEVNDV